MNKYLITFRPLGLKHTYRKVINARTDRTALKRVLKEYPASEGPGYRSAYRLKHIYERGLNPETGMMEE